MSSKKLSVILVMTLVLMVGLSDGKADERFTDNGDGTVTDTQTGLMWAKTDNQGDIDWKQAERWIKYTFPDTIGNHYNDWRLPTVAELKTLYVDAPGIAGYESDCRQNIKTVSVIRLSCGWVWTSETKAIQAWVFNFNRGYSYMARMAHRKGYRALPVRTVK